MSVLVAAGKIAEFEFQRLAVRRGLGDHVRTVPRVAIVDQIELVRVDVEHRDRVVVFGGVERRSRFLEFVHQHIAARSHAHAEVQRLHLGFIRTHLLFHGFRHVGGDQAFPVAGERL